MLFLDFRYRDLERGADLRHLLAQGAQTHLLSSVLLHDVPAGKVLRFYDHPFRSEIDDWVEVIVKRAVTRKYISSFERSFEDADVRVSYHRHDGLDGKISAAEVATTSMSAPPPPAALQ